MKNILNTPGLSFMKTFTALLLTFYISVQVLGSPTLIKVTANAGPAASRIRFTFAGDKNGNFNSRPLAHRSNIMKETAGPGAGESANTGALATAYFTTKENKTAAAATVSGELKKWHRVTITFDGPSVSETSSSNPFLNYRFDVVFTHTSGKSYKVPGYFAADGNAGETSATSGKKWRVHFTPDETGTWNYVVSFRQGSNIAVSDALNEGTAVSTLNGQTGSFKISSSGKTGKDLRAKGRLKYVGAPYLQFAETGDYFRKAGADSPENFLACQDFDNTPNYGGRRKTWAPHVQDWNTGDFTWKGGKGKGIIGAINYLSEQGMNVFSFLTFNIQGDDRNVYPYINETDFTRIDVSKLDQWEVVMEHAQKMGIYLHFKMQERENDHLLDGGNLGIKRKLYCRELIARFSHHLALNWNIGEENTQTTQQRKDMAEYIYEHDPYKHNIVIHTYPGEQEEVYRPLLGNAADITGVAIQTPTSNVYKETRKWVEASAGAGKKWIVANDEQNASTTGVAADAEYKGNRGTVADNSETIRKDVLWGNFMAGGAGVEYYFGYNTGETDLTCQDFRSRAKSWKYARYALEFFQAYLSSTELKPLNNVSAGWSLGKEGVAYIVYLKSGGTAKITLPSGNYTVKWYNPRKGGSLQNGSITSIGSGTVSIGNPPSEASSDWVVLIRKAASSGSTYQAEDRTAQSGTTNDTRHNGYTGNGYVDYGGNGTWIEWNNVQAVSGTATLMFYYTNGTSLNRQAAVTVNGTNAGNVSFVPTGGWTNWKTATITVTLRSGANVIRITANTANGGPNLDKMQLSAGGSARAVFAGAEEKRYLTDVFVYPNPTSGLVIISPWNIGQAITIYNGQGIKIYHNKFSRSPQIDLSAFGSGTYFMHLELNGKKYVRKIVVLK